MTVRVQLDPINSEAHSQAIFISSSAWNPNGEVGQSFSSLHFEPTPGQFPDQAVGGDSEEWRWLLTFHPHASVQSGSEPVFKRQPFTDVSGLTHGGDLSGLRLGVFP